MSSINPARVFTPVFSQHQPGIVSGDDTDEPDPVDLAWEEDEALIKFWERRYREAVLYGD